MPQRMLLCRRQGIDIPKDHPLSLESGGSTMEISAMFASARSMRRMTRNAGNACELWMYEALVLRMLCGVRVPDVDPPDLRMRYWDEDLRGEDNVLDFGTKFEELLHLDGGSLSVRMRRVGEYAGI